MSTKLSIKPAEGVTVRIKDQGKVLELDYDGAVCQHPGSLWWGTAVGFRAMQVAAQALSVNDLWDRERLYVVTGGCGMSCNSKMKYEWWVSDGERTANINLRPDFVPREFYELSDRLETNETTKEDIKSFRIFKVNLSTRIWVAPLEENFRVEVVDQPLEPGEVPVAAQASDYFDLQ